MKRAASRGLHKPLLALALSTVAAVVVLAVRAQAPAAPEVGRGRSLAAMQQQAGAGAVGGGPVSLEPAQVHGSVHKVGHVNLLRFKGDRYAEREALFWKWFETYNSRGSGPMPTAPPALVRPCQIHVNHKYKFIYIWIPKTGSTSLLGYLTQCQMSDAGPACVELLKTSLPEEEYARLWSEYFVFSAVRNPISRALSSYKFLLTRMLAEPESCTLGLSWGTYCADPMALGLRCRQAPKCCTWHPHYYWNHVGLQTRCLEAGGEGPSGGGGGGSSGGAAGDPISDFGGWAVDYLVRTESMEADLWEVFRLIDERRDPVLPALSEVMVGAPKRERSTSFCNLAPGERLGPRNVTERHKTHLGAMPAEQYCRTEEYFEGLHAGCLAPLQHFYARDLALLGLAGGGAGQAGMQEQ